MNTPTHALINWTIARTWGGKSIPAKAVLLGSVAPDIPLYLLSFGGIIWFRLVKGWETEKVGQHLFGNLFYNDVGWITAHNLLHSPTVLIAVLAGLVAWRGKAFWQCWQSWFFSSCLLHTLVDIPVHHDDGPLVFWPLNWTYRFDSPISYWDPHHFGIEVMIGEAVLVLSLLAWTAYRWKTNRSSS